MILFYDKYQILDINQLGATIIPKIWQLGGRILAGANMLTQKTKHERVKRYSCQAILTLMCQYAI